MIWKQGWSPKEHIEMDFMEQREYRDRRRHRIDMTVALMEIVAVVALGLYAVKAQWDIANMQAASNKTTASVSATDQRMAGHVQAIVPMPPAPKLPE